MSGFLTCGREREIHALSHYRSLTTLAFNHNQRKTLFSCNFVQNLTASESKVTVVEKVEDNVFFVPSLFALSKVLAFVMNTPVSTDH